MYDINKPTFKLFLSFENQFDTPAMIDHGAIDHLVNTTKFLKIKLSQ